MVTSLANIWHGFMKAAAEDPLTLWKQEEREETQRAIQSKKEHIRRIDPIDASEMGTHDTFYRY